MLVISWNPLVNHDFNLEGDYGLENGYTETIKFESGKDRILLKNSYVPLVYQLSLLLDNEELVNSKNTELKEFMYWFNVTMRYGTMPFAIPRIGYKRNVFTKTGEIGIYRFTPDSLTYDTIDGLVGAQFEIKELGYLEEVNYKFLMTETNEVLLTENGKFIIVEEEL